MRAGGPLLASEPGTGESRAGGPRPPRAEGPTPDVGLTPAMGSAAAELPQHRRSRGMGSLAPAGPGQPAGSPRRTFHIRKQPYKSRFRRRLPAPYMAIPAPGGGGAEPVCSRTRARPQSTGARGSPGPRKSEAAARAGGAGTSESCRQARGRRRVFAGRARPHPVCSARHYSPPLRLRGGAKRRRLTVSGAAPAAASMCFLGAGSAPKAGAVRSRKRGISGIPGSCRDLPAPRAPDESGGGLSAAPERDRPWLRAPPPRSGEQDTDKQRAPGTTWPQPPAR